MKNTLFVFERKTLVDNVAIKLLEFEYSIIYELYARRNSNPRNIIESDIS